MRFEFTALEVDTIGHQKDGAATFTDIEVELRVETEASDEKIE